MKNNKYRFEIIDPRLGESIIVEARTKLNAYLKALKRHNSVMKHKGEEPLDVSKNWERYVFCLGEVPVDRTPTPEKLSPETRGPNKPWIDVRSTKKAPVKRKRKFDPMNKDGKQLRERAERMDKYNKKRGLGKRKSKILSGAV